MKQFAIVNRGGMVLDDHGMPLIFSSERKADEYLQPHIRAWLKQWCRRAWLAAYYPGRGPLPRVAYASDRGREIDLRRQGDA